MEIGQRIRTLKDSDGDGIIQFSWNESHQGISVEIVDMFDNVVVGTFYKKDLLKLLVKVVKDVK